MTYKYNKTHGNECQITKFIGNGLLLVVVKRMVCDVILY